MCVLGGWCIMFVGGLMSANFSLVELLLIAYQRSEEMIGERLYYDGRLKLILIAYKLYGY